jgi:hypothetical protein
MDLQLYEPQRMCSQMLKKGSPTPQSCLQLCSTVRSQQRNTKSATRTAQNWGALNDAIEGTI